MVAADLREALEWRPDVAETRIFSYATAAEIDPFRPDLVFSLTAWRQPLRFRHGVTLFYVVNFTHERMPAGRFLDWDDALRMEADLYAANSAEGVAKLGRHKPARLIHMAANPRLQRPLGVDPRYRAQVTYLGSYNVATKGNEPFERYILPAAEFDLSLWGTMWQSSPPALRRCWRGRLPVPHVARLYSSVDVALGFNADSQAAAGMINNRVFEVLACGALLLSDRVSAIAELLGDVVVFTDGFDDTRQKLAHYLAHPEEREALTRSARERIVAAHTYDHRARDVVAMYAEHQRERGRL
jgi:spore maturation protein CgeB